MSILVFLLQLVNLVTMMAAQCYRYIQGECCLLDMPEAPLEIFFSILFINTLNNLRILAVLQVHLGTSSRRDCS